MPDHRFLSASCGETVQMTVLPDAQNPGRAARRGPPHLVVGLNVSHQDGQVLNAKVHIIVDVFVDALICWPGISRGRKMRMENCISQHLSHPILPQLLLSIRSSPSLGYYAAVTVWLKS